MGFGIDPAHCDGGICSGAEQGLHGCFNIRRLPERGGRLRHNKQIVPTPLGLLAAFERMHEGFECSSRVDAQLGRAQERRLQTISSALVRVALGIRRNDPAVYPWNLSQNLSCSGNQGETAQQGHIFIRYPFASAPRRNKGQYPQTFNHS